MLSTSLVANPFCNKRTERDREKMGEKEREGEGRETVNSQYHRLNPTLSFNSNAKINGHNSKIEPCFVS